MDIVSKCEKNFLDWENKRNQRNKELYRRVICECLGMTGESVFIGHHISFGPDGSCQQEIPSADTLMFDHNFIKRLFGDRAADALVKLALVDVDKRDQLLADLLGAR